MMHGTINVKFTGMVVLLVAKIKEKNIIKEFDRTDD
jgi:hypothetical protein